MKRSVFLAFVVATSFAAGAEFRNEPGPRRLLPNRTHGLTSDTARRGAVARLADGRRVFVGSDGELEPVPASAKLARSVNDSSERQYFVVVFYSDVSAPDAGQILARNRLRYSEHPDLLPSEKLIEATGHQASELARWDEVLRVYPASDALVAGMPVRSCHGGTMVEDPYVASLVAVAGKGWPAAQSGSAELTWSLTANEVSLPNDLIRSTIERALGEWSRHADLLIRFTTEKRKTRSIDFVFGSEDHGDPYPFDRRGGLLAHGFYPSSVNPEPIAGDVHFDSDETWSESGDPDFYSAALHEIGHSLGLGHSDTPGSVMYPYYSHLEGLAHDDVEALLKLYAPAKPVLPTPVVEVFEPAIPGPATELPAPPTPAPNPPSQAPPPPVEVPSVPLPSEDRINPTLSIKTPSAAVYATSATQLRVAGSAKDNAGIAEVTWRSGSASGQATGTSSWSFTVPLLIGDNRVEVRARDLAGNVGVRTVTITRR